VLPTQRNGETTVKTLVTKNEVAKAIGATRTKVERLVEAGVLPRPIERTKYWSGPAVLAAIERAGIPLAGLDGPPTREVKA
jgi:hypothetical protein